MVVQSLSCVQLFVTPWTAAHRVPLFMGFSKQEYWSWLPFPSPSLLFLNGERIRDKPPDPSSCATVILDPYWGRAARGYRGPKSLYFLLPWLPALLCPCRGPCNPSSCTVSVSGPHWDTPKSQGSLWSKFLWTTHMQR